MKGEQLALAVRMEAYHRVVCSINPHRVQQRWETLRGMPIGQPWTDAGTMAWALASLLKSAKWAAGLRRKRTGHVDE